MGGVTTQHLVDDLNPTGLPQVVEEVVGGAVARRYTYGINRISQRALMSTAPVAPDSYATPTDSYGYDAFGNLIGSTGTTSNVYRYQGEALDEETGLYYFRARYYDPVAGRFLTVDPLASEGEHPYEYAAADPVNGHDPTGEQDAIEYAIIVAAFLLPPTHVPPLQGHMSCLGGILFSSTGPGAGSGGSSGVQADASAAKIMTRLGLACQVGGKPGQGGPGTPGGPPRPKALPDRVKAVSDSVGPDPFSVLGSAVLREIYYDAYLGENLFPRSQGAMIREQLLYSPGSSQQPSPSGSPSPGAQFDDQVGTRNKGPYRVTQQFFITVPGTPEYRVQIEPCISNEIPGKLVWENIIHATNKHVWINGDEGSMKGRTCR